ncbi:MAG: Peptide/nickel transport system substrate-binding protein, partial [Chloroflexi bacterium]|nr:Peptide/nickel transport system substrate-binding protein [Chloroflexota bacterium]
TYVTPDGKVTPWLATSWTISNGGKRYVFTLRQGVKFHDGTPFDAAAVVANFKYIVNPNTHSVESITLLGPYQGAKALSKYQVELDLKSPFAPLLTYLSMPIMGFQSPAAIAKYGASLGDHPVGTGPFEFSSYVRPTALTFTRNPDYNWGPPAMHLTGPAKLDKIVYNIITSGQVRVQELQSGQAQIAAGVPPLFFKTLKADPSYQPLYVPIDGSGVYSMINNAAWPTNDAAVRKAILLSIDKVGVIKLSDAGQYAPTWGPLQKGTIGYDSSLDGAYAYNPAKAAQLLTADGWKKVSGIWTKNGKQLTLQITAIAQAGDFTDMATAQQGYLQKAGMVVNVRALAGTAWEASNTSGNFNLTGPLQFSLADPDLLRVMLTPKQFFNWARFDNPEATRMILQAGTLQSQSQRLALYNKAQHIIMDQAAMLPMRYNEDLQLLTSRLHGVVVTKGGFPSYYPAYFQ